MTSFDPPPSYQQAEDPDALPPPSYESLYGEFREIRSSGDRRGMIGFLGKVVNFVAGTAVFIVVVALANIIPIAMIIIGAIHLHDCPVQKYIPIWLIVSGTFSVVRSVLTMLYRLRNKFNSQREGNQAGPYDNVKQNPCDGLLGCFLMVWFVVGTVWVYGVHYEPNESKDSPGYCDPLTYLFSWWLITLCYVMIGCFVVFCCCCGCCILAATSSNSQNNAVGNEQP